jgi:hypothetical protein
MNLLKDNNFLYLPFQFKSKQVLSCKLQNSDVNHLDNIRKWAVSQSPSKDTSSHWWYNELHTNIKESFMEICYSRAISDMFYKKFGDNFAIDILHEMNEVYVSPPTCAKNTSDEVFYIKHIDGPYYYFPFASCYRLIVGMDDNKEIRTVFDMNPYDITVEKCDVVAFDYHRECHYIIKNQDKINNDYRVVLKIHVCIYPKNMKSLGKLLANMSIEYNKKFRSLFLFTIKPKNIIEKIAAYNVILWTKIYYSIEAYIGYNNIIYISSFVVLSYIMNNFSIFAISTSFIHYIRYIATYYHKYDCAYNIFVRDIIIYKLISDYNIIKLCTDYSQEHLYHLLILPSCMFTYFYIMKYVGLYRFCIAHHLGYLQENLNDVFRKQNILLYQIIVYLIIHNISALQIMSSFHVLFNMIILMQNYFKIHATKKKIE